MKEKTKLLQFFGSLIEKIKDILKGLGCLVFILEFYHKWSKLGRIQRKIKTIFKKLFKGPFLSPSKIVEDAFLTLSKKSVDIYLQSRYFQELLPLGSSSYF